MLRNVLSIVAGLVAWAVVATVLDRALRLASPDYAAVEAAMLFTLPMLAMRLVEGAVASFCAGLVVALIGAASTAAVVLGVVLLLFFVPVHYGLWERFPIWYHLVFLASLVVLPPLGYVALRRTHALRAPA